MRLSRCNASSDFCIITFNVTICLEFRYMQCRYCSNGPAPLTFGSRVSQRAAYYNVCPAPMGQLSIYSTELVLTSANRFGTGLHGASCLSRAASGRQCSECS
jgi:hypothetical protein